MVLGYGFQGGKGRCYNLWMDFVSCIDKARYDSYKDCKCQREDYYECLHQTKLVRVCSVYSIAEWVTGLVCTI